MVWLTSKHMYINTYVMLEHQYEGPQVHSLAPTKL